MYHNGQIVYNLDERKAIQVGGEADDTVWAWSAHNRRTTHFIRHAGYQGRTCTVELAMPATLEEAEDLLFKGIIMPAPLAATHFWRCRNWISNHENGRCTCPTED